MSEWDAFVFCTCFQDGLTTEPPYPRSDLTINRFGVVTLADSTDHTKDPETLMDWRQGWGGFDLPFDEPNPPCVHEYMKLVSVSPFYTPANWPDTDPHEFQGWLNDSECPVLSEVLYRRQFPDYPSGGIWVVGKEVGAALAELVRFVPRVRRGLRTEDAYFLENLQTLLEASVQTGNPIICHYNGIADDGW